MKREGTRREYLLAAGAAVATGLAGCSSNGGTPAGGDGSDGGGGNGDTDGSTPTPTPSTTAAGGSVDLTPWRVRHANPARTRSTPDQVPQELTKAATVTAKDFVGPGPGGRAPLVTGDGMFLFGNEAIGRFDASTLEKKHVQKFDRGNTSNPIPGYVTGDTIVAQVGGTFQGLAVSDGKRDWIVERKGVPFATGDGIGFVKGGEIGIMEADTRDVRWKKSREALNTRPPAVHTDSGTLFVQSKSDVLALDLSTGEQQWSLSRKKPTPLAVYGDAVYVLDEDGLLAVDRASGNIRWKQLEKGIMKLQIGGGGGPPKYAVDEDGFYAESLNKKVVALDRSDGTELWSTPITARRIGSLLAGSDGLVYRTSSGIRVLSKANGESRASTEAITGGVLSLAGGLIYGWRVNINRNVVAVGSG